MVVVGARRGGVAEAFVDEPHLFAFRRGEEEVALEGDGLAVALVGSNRGAPESMIPIGPPWVLVVVLRHFGFTGTVIEIGLGTAGSAWMCEVFSSGTTTSLQFGTA